MTRAKKRRQYGTGSVHLRKDGYWVGTVEAGWTASGTRRRITVYGHSESEARTKLKDKQRQVAAEGLPSSDVSARATVRTYAEDWLERVATKLRPASYNADRVAVTRWIVPTIGHKRFDALTPGDVRAIANAQRAAGNASSSALRTHATLMKMLRDAVLDGHPVPPRVREVERPRAGVSDRTDIPVPDALAILEQVAQLPHGSTWVAALLQGMRQGERLGLTWSMVDLTGAVPTLDISWQLQALPYLDTQDRSRGFRVPDGYEHRRLKGRLHLVRPKTARGRRVVPLVPWMTTSLRAWRDLAPSSPHDLVWPAADGSPADAKQDLEEWKALQGNAGVGHPGGRWYGTHEARHTTATLLLEAGVDPEVIKAILGHASILTSRSYQHVHTGPMVAALGSLAERLELS